MIRVLIVEDSPTARALLRAMLSSDQEFEIVGEASNGVEAVQMAQKLLPDVITMDIRMPRMDGFEATKEIMITAPTPIVIITSSYDAGDVDMSMHTLRAGAVAILAKPAGPAAAGFDETVQHFLAHIKAMAQVKVVRHWRARAPSLVAKATVATRGATTPVRMVALAASTGGPAALHQILSELPGDFPVPILIVQHISRGFVEGLADWLNKAGNVHVKIAEEGETLEAGTAYFAPDDHHLAVSPRGQAVLATAPALGGFRPSATFLYETAAHVYGDSLLAVILTGMGEDGVVGLHQVRARGGRILAQDERTSVVFGMPGAAIAAGLADEILPLENISLRLIELV